MRLLFRFLGFVCLAAAFAALIVDGATSVGANKIELHSMGDTLAKLAPAAVERVHTVVQAKMPTLWDPAIVSVLLLPTWIVLGVIGLVLLASTRKPRRAVGYSRR